MESKINIVKNPQEFFIQEVNRFEEGRLRELGELDKIIFIIGTGIFVLSINYITQSDERVFLLPILLLISWIFLISSIIFHSFGYKLSVSYHEGALIELREWAKAKFIPWPFIYSQKLKNKGKIILRFTNIAFWFLILGAVFLTFFVSYNFIYKNEINQMKFNDSLLIK